MTTMQTGMRPPVMDAAIAARFERRASGAAGPKCRVLVSGAGAKDLDVSGNLTGAIAHALWQIRGGDSLCNWCDAERMLEQLAGMAGEAGAAQAGTGVASGGARPNPPEIVVGGKKKFNRR